MLRATMLRATTGGIMLGATTFAAGMIGVEPDRSRPLMAGRVAPPHAAAGALQVAEVRGLEEFGALAGEWNSLVRATADEPFYRHEFLQAWMRAFATGARLRILVGRDASGRLTAALPMMQVRAFLRGVPIRELLTTANGHSCRSDLLAEDSRSAGQAFLEYLAADKGWDVLRLVNVPDGGKAHSLFRAAQSAGLPTGVWESQKSPYLDLPPSEEELDRRLSTQLKSLIRRRRRQLSSRGDLSLSRLTGGRLAPALEEFFGIEMRGWKGGRGTAVAQDDRTAFYYRLLADAASSMGSLSFFQLKLDGRTIAFHYGLTYGGTYYLPKLGYDEAYSELSPGLVLMDGVIRDAISRNLERCDLLGSDDAWKLRWSSGVLRHHWLYVFRDSLKGRLLKKLKFDWPARARHVWGAT